MAESQYQNGSQQKLPDALSKISQLLKTDDDLDKISTLKEQLIQEKLTLEVELKSRSQKQLDNILEKFQSLQLCQDQIKNLKNFIRDINVVANESFDSIERYELINKLTKIHEIFEIVITISERIADFQNELTEVDEMIVNEDYENIDIDHKVGNLLPIHYKLTKLLDFRDQILELSKFASDDSKFTVKRLFTRVNPVVIKFEQMISNIISGLVESVKIGNNSLVIRLAKIIEFEEVHDNRIRSKREILQRSISEKDRKWGIDKLLFEQIISGTVADRVEERGYKQFFINKIQESIKEIFENCWATFESKGEEPELFEILQNLDWVFSDLKCVQQDLTRLLPSTWDIFDIYFHFYYEELNKVVNKLIEREPETYFILDILEFDEKYREITKNEFGPKYGKTIIGENSKNQLLDDYLNLIVMKMNEWMGNLMKTEQDLFRSRLTAPEQDAEKLYALEGSKIVFQMFTQQCDVASGSGQGKILDGVISKFSQLLIDRQNEWSKIIKSEVSKLITLNNRERSKNHGNDEEEIEPVPPGLIEYLIALGNDQMRGADYTEAISNKYGSMVSKKYQQSITQNLENAIDGFANLAKQCCDGLIVLIFDDLEMVFKKIFDKAWFSNKGDGDNFVQLISDTIYEYFGDFNESMNQYLFEILTEEIIEEVVLRYLKNLHKSVSFKTKDIDKVLMLIKQDFEVLYKLFINFLSNDIIESKFKILEEFIDLISIDSKEETEEVDDQGDSIILEIWETMLRDFNDLPTSFLECCLKVRKYKNSRIKKLVSMGEIKRKNLLQMNQNQLQQTFMGRF